MNYKQLIDAMESVDSSTSSDDVKMVLSVATDTLKQLINENYRLLRDNEMATLEKKEVTYVFYPQWKTADSQEKWKCIKDFNENIASFTSYEDARLFLAAALKIAKDNYKREFMKYATKRDCDDKLLKANTIIKTRILCREIADTYVVKNSEQDINILFKEFIS